MAKPVRRKKGNVDTLDFSGVKSGGATIPDGRYKAKIISAELKEGKESGEPYRDVTWEITSDKCNGREVKFDIFSLQPQSLWKVKGLLEAMEIEVPDGEHDVDWDELIGDETECILELVGEKMDGRTFARPVGYAPLADGGTVDDDEEDDPKPKKKPAKDEEEDDTPPRRAGKKPAKDEDEEEEEDDPKPSNKKLKRGAKVKFKDEKNKLTKGTIESVDGDTATVVTDDEDTYEIDCEELTVIG
jgi:hypothetical protein